MIKFSKTLMCLILIVFTSINLTAQNNDFSIIMNRIRTNFSAGSNTTFDASVTTYLNSLNSNGSWSDIDYADHSATIWQPSNHWVRLSTFCRAYSKLGSSYYGSPTLQKAINKAINYWLELPQKPYSTNWYFGTISTAKDMGTVIIAMRYGAVPLEASVENAILNCMSQGIPITKSPAKDGSNLTDVAQNYIMRACITEDQSMLNQAIEAVSNSIELDKNSRGKVGEGLQPDNGFTSHGPQLYFYGYGDTLMLGINNICAFVKGTSYELATHKMAIYSKFVRKGMLKAVRGRYNDFNAFNRQISRPNAGKIGTSIFNNAKNVDSSENSPEYEAAISRINGTQPPSYEVSPEHIHFWRNDYTVHHRPKYMFGLRSVSTRTAKSENGNKENLKGYYLTEGANYIALNGDEYFNIFPVWEWNKIPGTTVPEITTYPLRPEWGVNFGKVSFVGAVSDGKYGASTYAMNDYNTEAKKSWFFFDDEVVCLGAGINSSANEAINTTVNQCLLNGVVNAKIGSNIQPLTTGEFQYTGNLQWAHHGNIGYFFPQGGNISLSNQSQSGTQQSINKAYSDALITKDVFKLWFQHGIKPSEATYTYIVTPGKSLEEMSAYNAAQIQIWSNTKTSQVVYHAGLDMLQLVFYKPGTITTNDYVISTNNACTILIKNLSTSKKEVVVSDPTQTLESVNLSVQNVKSGTLHEYSAVFPAGVMAGSSVMATITPSAPILFTATYDAYVRNGTYAKTNFPTGTLYTKNDGNNYTRKTYLQFDVASFTKKLKDAHLQLYVAHANTDIAKTQWDFYEVNDNKWTETGINWNNQPASQGKLIASVNGISAGNYVKIPITQTVLNSLNADKKLTIRISSRTLGGNTDCGFASREITPENRRPMLIVNNSENESPTTAITSPKANVNINPSSNITITANATDADGTIAKVEFFQGKTKLGESTKAPYIYNWNKVAAGTYDLTTKATDNNGRVSISEVVNITVKLSPTNSVISKSNNTVYSEPTIITISTDSTEIVNTTNKLANDQEQTKTEATLSANTPIALQEVINDSRIEMNPNPVKDTLNVTVSKLEANASIRVFNLYGKEFYNVPLNEVSQKLHLENLQSGTYIVIVQNGNQKLSRKIIKN